MKALLAFDKYKGSLSASQACEIAAKALGELDLAIETTSRPLSDGGEGFCEIVTNALGGVFRDYRVTYPDLSSGQAIVGYVFLDKLKPKLRQILSLPEQGLLAIIEMAQAAGHHQVNPATRDPWQYSTAGVGDLIRYAEAEGASSVLLGMGGSATNDMGVGLLEALGMIAMDEQSRTISPVTPSEWDAITHFEAPTNLPKLEFRIACDVRNPLHGPEGAAAVFGPQKGLQPEDQTAMQASMSRISDLLLRTENMRYVDVKTPGMGAAGGLPFGISLAFSSKLIPGFDLICEILDLSNEIEQSDIVFTGEGALDKSSLSGKGPYEIVRQSNAANKWVAVLPGKVFPEAEQHLLALHPKVRVLQVGLDDASIEENIRNEAVHLSQRVGAVVTGIFRP